MKTPVALFVLLAAGLAALPAPDAAAQKSKTPAKSRGVFVTRRRWRSRRCAPWPSCSAAT